MISCTISPGDDCKEEPTQAIKFPWNDKPLPACEKHVAYAKQLMTNLSRESELVIGELAIDADPGPETPRDAPARSAAAAAAPSSAEATTHAWRQQTIKLELELEQKRLERVKLELELSEKVTDITAQLVAGTLGFVRDLKAMAPELVQQFVSAQAAAATETSSSTVDGVSAPAECPPQEPSSQALEPDPRAP